MSGYGVQMDLLVEPESTPSYFGLLPERFSIVVKLQCMSSWNGFPVIADTYARVLSNSEMHSSETVFLSKNEHFWTFAVLDLILLINTCSFKSEMH